MTESKPDSKLDEFGERIRETVEDIKPKLRGWLHAATAPLALISFLVLLVLTESRSARIAVAIFMLSALLLFGVSAVYHTVPWRESVKQILRRLDHSNIFVMIAGSYTPFSILLLDTKQATILLTLVWGGAILGVLFKVFWLSAPRWVYVPLYLALGWAALIYLPDFYVTATTAEFAMLSIGGLLYTIGALVYGFKWPDPNPKWFGYHEVFHAFTIAAFIVHYIGVSLLVYSSN